MPRLKAKPFQDLLGRYQPEEMTASMCLSGERPTRKRGEAAALQGTFNTRVRRYTLRLLSSARTAMENLTGGRYLDQVQSCGVRLNCLLVSSRDHTDL